MAYFLGRDVKVAITTEHDGTEDAHTASNFGLSAVMVADSSAPAVPERETTIFGAATGELTNPVTDVISVDVTLGAIDEDIAYMGQRTALKAEIKKENTVVITKKKDSKLFDEMFKIARYGLKTKGSSGDPVAMGQDTLAQPAQIHGYRLHVQLKGSTEVLSLPNMTMSEHSVTLNADGVQEESMTFMGHVTPIISDGTNNATMVAVTSATSL